MRRLAGTCGKEVNIIGKNSSTDGIKPPLLIETSSVFVRYFRVVGFEEYRRFYAEEIRLAPDLTSKALVEAFARVPRERFLGPPPWQIASPDKFYWPPSA
jgi:hypothetical protein